MVQQGDLTDAYYFDFISFAQYATISREISMNPPMVFTEALPVSVGEDEQQVFEKRIIRRDASITNEMLAHEMERRVGATILNRFDELLGNTGAALPKVELGSRPGSGTLVLACFVICMLLFLSHSHGRVSTETTLQGLSQLVKLFVINGFAWGGDAALISSSQENGGKKEYCLTLNSPATLWGGQCLQVQQSVISNNFLYVRCILMTTKSILTSYLTYVVHSYRLKAAKELMRRYGYTVVSSSVKYNGSVERSYLTIV
jgi:hypothetical protein